LSMTGRDLAPCLKVEKVRRNINCLRSFYNLCYDQIDAATLTAGCARVTVLCEERHAGSERRALAYKVAVP
jgi:hypothetical protein